MRVLTDKEDAELRELLVASKLPAFVAEIIYQHISNIEEIEEVSLLSEKPNHAIAHIKDISMEPRVDFDSIGMAVMREPTGKITMTLGIKTPNYPTTRKVIIIGI